MKISIRTVIVAFAAIFAALSCQKESAAPDVQNQAKAGETIRVSISACLGDLVSADGTKATAESVVRLKWEDTDTVQAYCGGTKISGTKGLAVTPSENGMFASLTGEITAPEPGKTITFVYSSGCTTADGLTFDFSNQTDSIPFVAYGTLVYDGNVIEDRMVEFKLATSVMKIAATNLGGRYDAKVGTRHDEWALTRVTRACKNIPSRSSKQMRYSREGICFLRQILRLRG